MVAPKVIAIGLTPTATIAAFQPGFAGPIVAGSLLDDSLFRFTGLQKGNRKWWRNVGENRPIPNVIDFVEFLFGSHPQMAFGFGDQVRFVGAGSPVENFLPVLAEDRAKM